jgi:hypothetical protein
MATPMQQSAIAKKWIALYLTLRKQSESNTADGIATSVIMLTDVSDVNEYADKTARYFD